jgi:hypothetical protein
MLPAKVMPYLLRLAAPLLETLIVQMDATEGPKISSNPFKIFSF